MKNIMKILGAAVLAIGILIPMQARAVITPGATVALITTTQTVAIETMLTNQGIIFDKFVGAPFDAATVTLVGAGYSSVIVGMNGGLGKSRVRYFLENSCQGKCFIPH